MKKYWQLFWQFKKIELMKMMEYRSDFWFWLVVSIMWTSFNYFFYSLILGHSKSIAGWSYDEVMILLSFFTMLDAFTWSVFWPNMQDYTESIYSGSFNKLLLLPVNDIFYILNQRVTFHNFPRFLIGLAVIIKTTIKLGIKLSLAQVITTSFIFIIAVIFLYSLYFILATISFWVERLKNINDIIPAFRSIYQMPVQIYTGIASIIFTFILPFGLTTTLPSEVILGRANPYQLLYFTAITFMFVTFAQWFYHHSITKYSSVGN